VKFPSKTYLTLQSFVLIPLRTYLLIVLTFLVSFAFGQDDSYWIKFQENKGQWEDDLSYMARISEGYIYVGDQEFAIQLKNKADMDVVHKVHHGEVTLPENFKIRYHTLNFKLKNAQPATRLSGSEKFHDYVNYFLGKDTTKWAGGVEQYGRVTLRDVYPNIDFHLLSVGQQLKYEFTAAAGAEIDSIAIEIEGADGIELINDQLEIATSIQRLIDQKPLVWQIVDGKKRFIDARYTLHENVVGFDLDGYDKRYPVVIDPTLIFSSFTGSGADNWGFTATYDETGHLYGGGTVFNDNTNSYPTTTGAYDVSWGGGSPSYPSDVAITKFASDGATLDYSTYLGGAGNECPHSLVVNGDDELYVLGTTGSNDFPTSATAYDDTFNGGTNFAANSISYPNGSDIFVTKFNASGTGLIGSTYLGGSGNDGNNLSTDLKYCYGDEFRGEIIVDSLENCYIASNTSSTNFPVVNPVQTAYGGGTSDGVAVKFNANLSSLIWSTYLGGSGDDAGYSVQFELPSNDVYITGGTTSSNFTTTTGVINPTYGGGTDGFLCKISSTGTTLLASTYIGTSGYDQSYFVQLDLANNVYVVGQTDGTYPIGPTYVYSVPGGGQFLHKLSNNLQTTEFSTEFGLANNSVDIALSAFLVNDCNHIFISGWGGTLNNSFGQATASTVTGLPTTGNAYQTTTDGNDFWIVVFEDSATNILFSTFFGGTGNSGEHVDGGTSRFDKKGIVYQAVCAGCGGGNTFPTTTGAYSTTNGSSNCNLGVLKYDLVTLEAEADINGPNNVCLNDSIEFVNSSVGGSLYFWDFGDGVLSTDFEPKHAYDSAGSYTVQLVIFDSVSCIASDTDLIQLNVIPGPQGTVNSPPPICPGTNVQLIASGGSIYTWFPAAGLSNANIANPIANIQSSAQYIVNVEDSCGVDQDTIFLVVHPDPTSIMPDTAMCQGQSGPLRAEGANVYQWTPGIYLSGTGTSTPICAPDSTTDYTVYMVDSLGCNRTKKMRVTVDGFLPEVEAWGDTTVCAGERVELSAASNEGYEWFPKEFILDPFISNTPAYPEETTYFIVKSENGCGSIFDTVIVIVDPIQIDAVADTAVCEGDTVKLGAEGTYVYIWEGPAFANASYNQYPVIRPTESAWYTVTGQNLNGCTRLDSTYVTVFENPTAEIATRLDTFTGLTNLELVANASSNFTWQSVGFIPCDTCDTIVVYPLSKTVYYVHAIDSNGCSAKDSVEAQALSKIYAPSAFTPDKDGFNEKYFVYGHNLQSFEIVIRDRWGQELYRSKDISKGWNGLKFNTGFEVPIGVYSYTIEYTVLPDQKLVQMGTITLLR
jgi:gliding motility-associated-like protein